MTIKSLQSLINSRRNQMNLFVKQTRYGWMKVVSFTLDQSSHGCKIKVLKFIRHLVKENLLLLKVKYLSKLFRIKSTNE